MLDGGYFYCRPIAWKYRLMIVVAGLEPIWTVATVVVLFGKYTANFGVPVPTDPS